MDNCVNNFPTLNNYYRLSDVCKSNFAHHCDLNNKSEAFYWALNMYENEQIDGWTVILNYCLTKVIAHEPCLLTVIYSWMYNDKETVSKQKNKKTKRETQINTIRFIVSLLSCTKKNHNFYLSTMYNMCKCVNQSIENNNVDINVIIQSHMEEERLEIAKKISASKDKQKKPSKSQHQWFYFLGETGEGKDLVDYTKQSVQKEDFIKFTRKKDKTVKYAQKHNPVNNHKKNYKSNNEIWTENDKKIMNQLDYFITALKLLYQNIETHIEEDVSTNNDTLITMYQLMMTIVTQGNKYYQVKSNSHKHNIEKLKTDLNIQDSCFKIFKDKSTVVSDHFVQFEIILWDMFLHLYQKHGKNNGLNFVVHCMDMAHSKYVSSFYIFSLLIYIIYDFHQNAKEFTFEEHLNTSNFMKVKMMQINSEELSKVELPKVEKNFPKAIKNQQHTELLNCWSFITQQKTFCYENGSNSHLIQTLDTFILNQFKQHIIQESKKFGTKEFDVFHYMLFGNTNEKETNQLQIKQLIQENMSSFAKFKGYWDNEKSIIYYLNSCDMVDKIHALQNPYLALCRKEWMKIIKNNVYLHDFVWHNQMIKKNKLDFHEGNIVICDPIYDEIHLLRKFCSLFNTHVVHYYDPKNNQKSKNTGQKRKRTNTDESANKKIKLNEDQYAHLFFKYDHHIGKLYFIQWIESQLQQFSTQKEKNKEAENTQSVSDNGDDSVVDEDDASFHERMALDIEQKNQQTMFHHNPEFNTVHVPLQINEDDLKWLGSQLFQWFKANELTQTNITSLSKWAHKQHIELKDIVSVLKNIKTELHLVKLLREKCKFKKNNFFNIISELIKKLNCVVQ